MVEYAVQNDAEFVLDEGDPLMAARAFVRRNFTQGKRRLLHHWRGEFWRYCGTHFSQAELQGLRAEMWLFLDRAKRQKGKTVVPFKPTPTRVAGVIDALAAITNLPSNVEPPTWLDGADNAPPATEFLVCANGLLHLPSRELDPHTPSFFSLSATAYAFDEAALESALWLAFLGSLWPDDHASIDALQEWFGYCLTADTRQQKILLIVGPRRSGKGTIARVLTALLGQHNVAGPTLASLSSNFGLSPLIGKSLAIISDARFGTRADQGVIVERLLSISGEDGLTVDRKYAEPWTGRLPTRLMILTNELPRLADTSGAFLSRFIVLVLSESFLGREDHDLTQKLVSEGPGILLWAVAGLERLQWRGRFAQPESATDALQALGDITSPVGAFVRDRCLIGREYEVACGRLFEAWRVWCAEQGRGRTGNAQGFGRDLRAVVPSVRTKVRRAGDGFERAFVGVMLE